MPQSELVRGEGRGERGEERGERGEERGERREERMQLGCLISNSRATETSPSKSIYVC
jgi:hypothetical protein